MFAAGLALAVSSYAVETKFWQQYDPADFEKATMKNIALRSDGRLSLAPVFREVHDAATTFLWAVAEDSKGNVYSGGGSPGSSKAKLFVTDAAGKSKVLAELDGLEIHAIAVDTQDRVYVATSPDGKVYRVNAAGRADVFYDPKAKYIWALAHDRANNLYIATGDKGEVHRVTPAGQGSVWFSTDETHARSIAVDPKGNVIVGTEPGGLILRVNAQAAGFVVHQAAKREITAIAIAKDGTIYAAGVGNKTAATVPPPPAGAPPPPPPGAPPATVTVTVGAGRPAPPPPTLGAAVAGVIGGTDVYRIDPDGAPRRIWTHSADVIYAIALDANQRPLLGTGNRGRIVRLDDDRLSTVLIQSTSTQVTGFAVSRRGPVFAVTANVGKLYQLGPDMEKEGTLDSDVLDAGAFSYFGRARYEGGDGGGKVSIETRSGNLDRPQKNWSQWDAVRMNPMGGRMTSPAARFLQYRVRLEASASGASPQVTMVELAYLMKNLAPVVEIVESTPGNYKFPSPSSSLTASQTLNLPSLGQRVRGASGIATIDSGSGSMSYGKGWIGARWRASDENGDSLSYKVEIKGVSESDWKLLKADLREARYSWDSTAFADGYYQVRVTASDAPSNPPAQALTAQLASEQFLIDNTAPVISGLAANADSGRVNVRWKARDARSVIEKGEYSINGGDWLVAQPISRLADSTDLDFLLQLERTVGGEMTIAVRVTDEFDNQVVDKVTVR